MSANNVKVRKHQYFCKSFDVKNSAVFAEELLPA